MNPFVLFEWTCGGCEKRISVSVTPEGDTASLPGCSAVCRCGHELSPGERFDWVHPSGERTTCIVPRHSFANVTKEPES